MTTQSKPSAHGRARKGWKPLNLKVSPQAKARLMEHSQAMGVEIGALLNALILGKLTPEPHYPLPPSPESGGSGMLLWLCAQQKEPGTRDQILALLAQASGAGPDCADFLGAWADEPRRGGLLRRCMRTLRGSYLPPGDMEALAWLHCKTMAQRVAEGLYEDCRRGRPETPGAQEARPHSKPGPGRP
jgi:hypothetical protein